mgnify:CR=1 FL=1|jgi:hypothetical protein
MKTIALAEAEALTFAAGSSNRAYHHSTSTAVMLRRTSRESESDIIVGVETGREYRCSDT